MSHSQGWLDGTHLATRFCTCFAALLTLSAGAYPQAASEPTRPTSAGDSSVTRQPISIDEVSAALARLSGFVAFQHRATIHQRYARGGAFHKPINIKSASKSILNALTGIALQRGDLASLDTPISAYLPQYFAPIPEEWQAPNHHRLASADDVVVVCDGSSAGCTAHTSYRRAREYIAAG